MILKASYGAKVFAFAELENIDMLEMIYEGLLD